MFCFVSVCFFFPLRKKNNNNKKPWEREEKKKYKNKTNKKNMATEKITITKKRTKKSNLAASHPSVKGQRPQERWIGVYTGNHRRHPLPSPIFRLRSGYRRSGCRPGSSRIDSVRGGRTRDSIIGEATFRSQSAARKRMSHLNFLGSNSIFKKTPAGWNRCARQRAKHAWLRTLYTTCI